jgi:hypothetical protein
MTAHVEQTGDTYMTLALLLLVVFAGMAGPWGQCSAPVVSRVTLWVNSAALLVNHDAGATIDAGW